MKNQMIKTKLLINIQPVLLALSATLLAGTAHGQLFVSNYGYGGGFGSIGEYATSGTTVNANLISGTGPAYGLTLDGNGNLF